MLRGDFKVIKKGMDYHKSTLETLNNQFKILIKKKPLLMEH